MPETVDLDDWTLGSLTRTYQRSIEMIVADLRQLADRVEQRHTPPHSDRRRYAGQAEDVLADVMNCLPNLRLGLLMERAYDLDLWLMETKDPDHA